MRPCPRLLSDPHGGLCHPGRVNSQTAAECSLSLAGRDLSFDIYQLTFIPRTHVVVGDCEIWTISSLFRRVYPSWEPSLGFSGEDNSVDQILLV